MSVFTSMISLKKPGGSGRRKSLNAQEIEKQNSIKSKKVKWPYKSTEHVVVLLPANFPSCPPGLEKLITADHLFVRQGMREPEPPYTLITKSKFEVLNGQGKRIFLATEASDNILKLCCRGGCGQPFQMSIKDRHSGYEILAVNGHPDCYGAMEASISQNGMNLGFLHEEIQCCSSNYIVIDAQGNKIFRIYDIAGSYSPERFGQEVRNSSIKLKKQNSEPEPEPTNPNPITPKVDFTPEQTDLSPSKDPDIDANDLVIPLNWWRNYNVNQNLEKRLSTLSQEEEPQPHCSSFAPYQEVQVQPPTIPIKRSMATQTSQAITNDSINCAENIEMVELSVICHPRSRLSSTSSDSSSTLKGEEMLEKVSRNGNDDPDAIPITKIRKPRVTINNDHDNLDNISSVPVVPTHSQLSNGTASGSELDTDFEKRKSKKCNLGIAHCLDSCISVISGGVEFNVYSCELGVVIGRVSKQWEHLYDQYYNLVDCFGVNFPRDLSVRHKALMLGALFLLDFNHFQL